jgi:hypothetical protein
MAPLLTAIGRALNDGRYRDTKPHARVDPIAKVQIRVGFDAAGGPLV